MRKFMLVLVMVVAAACSGPVEPTPVVAEPSFNMQPTCRSGYAIANRNGEWVCVDADGNEQP